MKSKMSIIILLASFLFATLILVSILVVMLQTGALSKRTAAIILPSEGGYVEAWTPHLPQIARKVGIPEITILTYDSYDKLKTYFLHSEKYNTLWAEVPVTGEYNLKTLLNEVSTSIVDNKTADYFPPALFKTIKSYTEKKEVRFLPLSYNPWIIVKKNNPPAKTEFEYSSGAYYDNVAFATLTFARKLGGTEKDFLTIDEGLADLQKMSNDKTFITNVRTYTNKDAYSVLESDKVRKTILPIYFFNELSVAQRLELSIEPFSSTLITDATVAIFANRKSEEAKSAVEKSKEYLLNTELLYSTANSRAWIPAHINTVSRSIYTDYIRKQSRQVSRCLIPEMQFESKKERNELIEKLNIALRTNYFSK